MFLCAWMPWMLRRCAKCVTSSSMSSPRASPDRPTLRLEAYYTVDVLPLWKQFETQCPVEKYEKRRRCARHSFPPCEVVLHNVLVLRDFRRESVKALLLYQLRLLYVFKTCCFNCFDKEIKLLPVILLPCLFHWQHQSPSQSADSRGQRRAERGLRCPKWIHLFEWRSDHELCHHWLQGG